MKTKKVAIKKSATAAPSKICFVVSPIGGEGDDIRIHADWVLEGIIKPVFKAYPEFDVVRSDKDSSPGMIDSQIIKTLLDAELVIADLSTLNPNVFYEIGIRHMAQRPIIHMQLQDEKIPFDVSLYRALKFSRTRVRDLEKARDDLKSMVDIVLSGDHKIDNPVTRARGEVRLQEHATPEQKVLLEQIESIKQRLEEMDRGGRRPRFATIAGFVTLQESANEAKVVKMIEETLHRFPHRVLRTGKRQLRVWFRTELDRADFLRERIAHALQELPGLRSVEFMVGGPESSSATELL